MSVQKIITVYEERGYNVKIRLAEPCVFVEVDDSNIGPFYSDMAAARKGASRHIDEAIKAKEKKR